MSKVKRFSARASLAAVGQWMGQQRMWEKVDQQGKIQQKVLRGRGLDKVLDGNYSGKGKKRATKRQNGYSIGNGDNTRRTAQRR
jgi:hypothetical protein